MLHTALEQRILGRSVVRLPHWGCKRPARRHWRWGEGEGAASDRLLNPNAVGFHFEPREEGSRTQNSPDEALACCVTQQRGVVQEYGR